MNKKGFTLVELLAVIAILAILVIVAMPNVLSRFNAAKKSSFATEVQTIIKEAQTQFVQDKITKSGSITYNDTEVVDNNSGAVMESKLNMSGNQKNYRIEMDTNGNIKNIIVYDANYCWAGTTTSGTTGIINGTDVKEAEGTLTNGKTSGILDYDSTKVNKTNYTCK